MHNAKPFISVCGKPILQHAIHRLRLGPEDAVWVLGRPSMQHYYEDLDWPSQVQWLPLAEETRGAAETVAMGIQAIRGLRIDHQDQEERPLLILDGDSFYRLDVTGIFRNLEIARYRPNHK